MYNTSIFKLAFIFVAFTISAFAYVVPWSEDFSTNVTLNTSTAGLSAADWYISGAGINNTPDAIVLDEVNDRVVLSTGVSGNNGALQIGAYGQGQGTPFAGRLVDPGDYEVTHTFDMINFRGGQADVTVRSRGLDGYVQYKLSPSGRFIFSHWWSNYNHKTFNSFNGPSKLRNNANNPGIVIVEGGTFDPASADLVTVTISESPNGSQAVGEVVMNAEGTAVASVTLTDYGSGFTAEPTVTFAGGGMTVAPTVSFNFETGNGSTLADGSSSTNQVTVELGSSTFVDGESFTIAQVYDAATDSISYYYGLNDDPVTNLITTVVPATNSAGGYGFYDVVTGNRYSGNPQNKDAVYIRYQQWGTTTNNGGNASIALSNYALKNGTGIDADSDGVLDRDDAFPDDATETVDSDSDGVGDNADAHDGYDDTTFTPYLNTWLSDNNYIVNDGTSGGISQAAYDAVVAERDARPTQASYDAVVAERDAIPTAAEVQSTFLSDRVDSVGVSVSGGEATISLQVEQSDDDMTTWTAPSEGAADVTIPVSGDATFFRVRAQ